MTPISRRSRRSSCCWCCGPRHAEYLRLRGLLYEQLECFASALADFRRYLTLAPDAAAAAEIRTHLERLEQRHHDAALILAFAGPDPSASFA